MAAQLTTDINESSLSLTLLEKMSDEFRSNSKNILAMNAITKSTMSGVLVSRDANMDGNPHVFSHHIDNEAKATNQKASGRCWLFATTNVLRLDVIKKYNLGADFELSQTFLFWYDKLEKCSWFLDNIVKTADEPLDGRLVQFLLQCPVNDGGQWDMAVNLIEKYGLVPKSAFPESAHAGATHQLNWLITVKLREAASILRNLIAQKSSLNKINDKKKRILSEIYRIMAITLGEPPKTFHWSFRNKNKEYQSYDNLTPLSFYKDHITRDVSQWISLIHDPRNEYNKLYTVDYLGNVIGGRQVLYLNVPIQELKKYSAMVIKGSSSSAKKEEEEEEKGAVDKGGAEVEKSSHQPKPTTSVGSSKNGEPVWFGCDVGKFSDRSVGIMDLKYYDYNSAYDINFGLNKANRLRYGESAMTHAMTLNAVDIIQDEEEEGKELKVRRWRVENSWGEDRGENGYFTMTDDWFDEYVYQVVIDRNILSDELKKVLDTEKPIVFPPWDPLGALA